MLVLAKPEARRSHFTSLNGVQYPYPVCAMCHRDVEAFTWADHASHETGEEMRTFFARCHGVVDTVSLRLEDMRTGELRHFRIETAFAPPPLPAGEAEVTALALR